jgi:hypothetical protein
MKGVKVRPEEREEIFKTGRNWKSEGMKIKRKVEEGKKEIISGRKVKR